MIPLRDALPAREPPRMTLTCLAVLAMAYTGVWTSPAPLELLATWSVAPAASTWPEALAAPWLHAGVLPLVAGAAALWLFGEGVEDRLGARRFLLLLVSCTACGILGHASAHAASRAAVAGSGVIAAGIIGAHLRLYPSGRLLAFAGRIVEVPAAVVAAGWLLVQALDAGGLLAPAGLVRGWSLPALAASGAAGALLATALDRPERRGVEWFYREG
ncbi:MAG TPA: rhomboid family intramembrane serine protease [Vicinamibacterales bacterium]